MKEIKSTSLRLEYSLWKYLKKLSFDTETSINELITMMIMRDKMDRKKGLLKNDLMVSSHQE